MVVGSNPARDRARGHNDELLLRQDQLGHQVSALQDQLELVLQFMSHGVARASLSPHLAGSKLGSKSRPVGMREVGTPWDSSLRRLPPAHTHTP